MSCSIRVNLEQGIQALGTAGALDKIAGITPILRGEGRTTSRTGSSLLSNRDSDVLSRD